MPAPKYDRSQDVTRSTEERLQPVYARSKAIKPYRRHEVTEADEDGYVWINPSVTINPSRPRTQLIGYNLTEKRVRTVFRPDKKNPTGQQWQYSEVSAQEWERLRRVNSTGRFIARILDHKPYSADSFTAPAQVHE